MHFGGAVRPLFLSRLSAGVSRARPPARHRLKMPVLKRQVGVGWETSLAAQWANPGLDTSF